MKLQSALLLAVLLVLGLAHASASPIGRILSRLRKTAGAGGSDLSIQYIRLHAGTVDLAALHSNVYRDFKNERYPNVTDPRFVDVVLSFLPSTSDLPKNRENHSDDELLEMHYNKLIIFKDTLVRVEETETGNITNSLTTVAEKLNEVIHRVKSLMDTNEFTTDPTETIIPTFHANVTTEEQNTRTLIVLQEFHSYIIEVLIDYTTLKTRYSTSQSAK